MKTDIEPAMKSLSAKVAECSTADEALKYTQAMLNLAHVEAVQAQTAKQ